MPYKLSRNGIRELDKFNRPKAYIIGNTAEGSMIYGLTDLQKKALRYLEDHLHEDRFIDAREVAMFYGYPNGQYFRGVLASLHKKGLITKIGE